MTVARVAYVLLSLCCAAKCDESATPTGTCSSPDCIADNGPHALKLLQNGMKVHSHGSLPHPVNHLEGPSKETVSELQPAAVLGSNSSFPFLFERSMSAQFEYELVSAEMPMKNKILLVLIEGLCFGMCGIDRCYMGQTCLGIIKGVTFGGLGLWALMDYVIVMYNCLAFSPDVQFFGLQATFVDGTVTPAFWIAAACLTMKLVSKVMYLCSGSKENDDDPKPTCETTDESISPVVVS